MVLKRILDVALCIFAFISVMFIGCYATYVYRDKGLYEHSTSTYVAKYKDPQTNKEINPFEINYYENYNGTGKEVIEWRINGYSDQSMQAIYGRGYQLVINGENKELYYCDTYNGNSWESMHKYNETTDSGANKNFFYVSINNKIYAIRVDGYTTREGTTVNAGNIVGNVLLGPAWWIFNGFYSDLTTTEIVKDYYTYEDLLLHFRKLVKSCSAGTGDFELSVVDLGAFIHVYNCEDTGKADPQPIGIGGQINSYFSIDVHYDKRGMSYAEQSIFGSVAGDNNFNITGIDFDVNYWKATTQFNITEKDFVARYSNADLGYYYSLSSNFINELKNYKNLDIYINFDISKIKNVNVLGFDYYALNGINIAELTITSDIQRDFTLLSGALRDTGISKINSINVNVINLSGTEVNAYEMV